MGGGRETTVTNTTSTPTPTPEETRLNQLEIQRVEATQPGQIAVQQQGLDLINRLLTGSTNLPGFFGEVGRGISPERTSDISNRAVQDILPSFQSSGILDSGVAVESAARVAGDVRRASEEYNLNNRLNLLNLALSGQAQIQQPLLQQSNELGGRLAGLRTINQSGTSTVNKGNPFLNSFQQSFGSGLGSAFSNPLTFTSGGRFR